MASLLEKFSELLGRRKRVEKAAKELGIEPSSRLSTNHRVAAQQLGLVKKEEKKVQKKELKQASAKDTSPGKSLSDYVAELALEKDIYESLKAEGHTAAAEGFKDNFVKLYKEARKAGYSKQKLDKGLKAVGSGTIEVKGYTRADGSEVKSHTRNK